MNNNRPGFAHLADVEQKYLEYEFLRQHGDEDELEKIYFEYVKDEKIHIKLPSDRRLVGSRIDEYVGISLQELEDRLMIKNRAVCKLQRFYHRYNAIRLYLHAFIQSSNQERLLNTETARNLLTDRGGTLCSAMRKILQEDRLDNRLRVEDRGYGQKYLIKLHEK